MIQKDLLYVNPDTYDAHPQIFEIVLYSAAPQNLKDLGATRYEMQTRVSREIGF